MSSAGRTTRLAAADVEAWLHDLAIRPLERVEREGVTAWDLRLAGRRRAGLHVTLILDPGSVLVGWGQLAPPITDAFRRSYRRLLRWNDELPFVKLAVTEDERPLVVTELDPATAGPDDLGLALARIIAVADRLHAEVTEWLAPAGRPTGPPEPGSPEAHAGIALLERHAPRLGDLVEGPS